MKTTSIINQQAGEDSAATNTIAMKIDDSSTVFLMDMLGKMYVHPAQAVLREYLSNAYDAHTSKGGDLPPIQVGLPGQRTKTLSVRDFGNGMSEEAFTNILSQYGASTKRESNKLIGGFGVGAKAGFAVGDEFFMTSYQNGQGLRFRLYKDSQNQGYIQMVKRFSTSQPDGMLVEVEIPENNLPELGIDALSNFFLGYDPATLSIVYEGSSYDDWNTVFDTSHYTAISLNGHPVGWRGKRYGLYKWQLTALVGKVFYRLNPVSIINVLRENESENAVLLSLLEFLNNTGLENILNLPIGSVEMPPSREEITLSERSFATIINALTNYSHLLHEHFQRDINAKTYSQALQVFAELEQFRYSRADELTWQGKPLGRKLFQSSEAVVYHVVNSTPSKSAEDIARFETVSFARMRKHSGELFVITVNSSAEAQTVQNQLNDKETFRQVYYSTRRLSSSLSSHMAFVVLTKDDALYEIMKDEPAYSAAQVDKISISLQKKAALAAKRDEQERKDEASKLTYFSLADINYVGLRKDKAPKVFDGQEDTEMFYWSEEELSELGFTKATNFAFPYTFHESTADYSVDGLSPSSNQRRILTFLRFFLPTNSYVILQGKECKIASFKASYPSVKSGVQAIQTAIKNQLADNESDLCILRAGLDNLGLTSTDNQSNLMNFFTCLEPNEKVLLPENLRDADEQIHAFHKVKEKTSYIGKADWEKMLRCFSPVSETIPTPPAGQVGLEERYPLLFVITNFTSEKVRKDVIAYLNSK